ncbi:hypothetical protein P3T76_006672 [Phytophthora citrophthora]|uniref:Uncharacterized protein n=1 Tax=Phytophthora citrophthora TaxID=4793 RepID=A0AAD9GNU2_9STRA|nr:hypothetical protein P3T76_012815 [Phytophthora citrophthora]KAK1941608.1 hypothetical protein P3T76_006672 [Phytophthora citrophthora]
MPGKLRLPPDKRMYEDDIVPETPPPQSPPPKRVKRQDVKDRIARDKTLDFSVMMKTLKHFSKPEVPVHKVLHCLRKHGGCGESVDRDVNAAKNSILQNHFRVASPSPAQASHDTNQSSAHPSVGWSHARENDSSLEKGRAMLTAGSSPTKKRGNRYYEDWNTSNAGNGRSNDLEP